MSLREDVFSFLCAVVAEVMPADKCNTSVLFEYSHIVTAAQSLSKIRKIDLLDILKDRIETVSAF